MFVYIIQCIHGFFFLFFFLYLLLLFFLLIYDSQIVKFIKSITERARARSRFNYFAFRVVKARILCVKTGTGPRDYHFPRRHREHTHTTSKAAGEEEGAPRTGGARKPVGGGDGGVAGPSVKLKVIGRRPEL